MWIQIAIYVVTMIVSYALQAANAPKPQKPTAGNLDVPAPDPGAITPVAFGTNLYKGANVIWYGDAATVPVTKSGGKK